MKRDAAFQVVKDFEQALCEYTGAKYAVTTDSCTNALFLALKWVRYRTQRDLIGVTLPKHTYVGVVQAAKNAGYDVALRDLNWMGHYQLFPHRIWDAAKNFFEGMYSGSDWYGTNPFLCVSFQAGKLLPIGRGGAILHDNDEADEWLRRARLDGRTAGADYADATFQREGWHCYMTPPDAARGLWLMTYLEDDDKGDWTEYPDLSEATWL